MAQKIVPKQWIALEYIAAFLYTISSARGALETPHSQPGEPEHMPPQVGEVWKMKEMIAKADTLGRAPQ